MFGTDFFFAFIMEDQVKTFITDKGLNSGKQPGQGIAKHAFRLIIKRPKEEER